MTHLRQQIKNATTADLWRTACGILAAIMLGALALGAANRIIANTAAIKVSCIQLNNAVIKSQREAARKGSPTFIAMAILLKRATPAERQAFNAAVTRQARDGSPLIVDCNRIAANPDDIEAVPLAPPTPEQTPPISITVPVLPRKERGKGALRSPRP